MYAKKINNYEDYLDEVVFSNNVFSYQSLQRRLKKLHRKDNDRYSEFIGLITEIEKYNNDDVVSWRGDADVSSFVSDLVRNWADYLGDIDKLNKIRTTMLEDYDSQLSDSWEEFEEKIETDMNWSDIRPFLRLACDLSDDVIKNSDEMLFEKAKDTDTIEAFQDYLAHSTECSYRKEANKRIEELQEKKQQALEEGWFNEAVAAQSVDLLQKYINGCIIGRFKDEAEQLIKKLKQSDQPTPEVLDSDLFNKAKAMDTVEAYQEYLAYSDLCAYREQAENRIVYLEKNNDSSHVESKKCPKCGKEYTSNYTICLKDGTTLISV